MDKEKLPKRFSKKEKKIGFTSDLCQGRNMILPLALAKSSTR